VKKHRGDDVWNLRSRISKADQIPAYWNPHAWR